MGWRQWIDTNKELGSLALGLTVAVVGVATSVPASAQIANTKHNLGTSTSTATRINTFNGTAEICVFCHTPHGADTSAAVPLWNRVLPAANTFTTYNTLGTSTLDGATVPVGSVSIACLSCHDGVTSMSTVINQPGSGGYNSAGAAMSGTWSGANQTGGAMAAGIITNIGKDLRNDHPIGIQYGGGGINMGNVGTTSTATVDPDFKAVKTSTLNGSRVWWVDTEATPNNTRQKTDMILYTRAAAGGAATATDAQPFVECASCHDPHTTNATFLRISNAGSAVCLACHVK